MTPADRERALAQAMRRDSTISARKRRALEDDESRIVVSTLTDTPSDLLAANDDLNAYVAKRDFAGFFSALKKHVPVELHAAIGNASDEMQSQLEGKRKKSGARLKHEGAAQAAMRLRFAEGINSRPKLAAAVYPHDAKRRKNLLDYLNHHWSRLVRQYRP